MSEGLSKYFQFTEPEWLNLFWLFPVLIGLYVFNSYRNRDTGIRTSSLRNFTGVAPSAKQYMRHSLFVLRMIALAFLICAMARPQKKTDTLGVDIMLSLDISASMLATDLKPNRLDAAKQVAMEFIDQHPNDRMGLVIFSGESFTQCPLTTDHAVLKAMFKQVEPGMIEAGTAIGLGLSTAVSRIKDSKAKSKIVILLTDGVNNAGSVSPLTAAEIAKTFDVRVYTIGAGTMGMARSPVQIGPGGDYIFDYVPVEIDEETMTKIAEMTGGKYFRATDNKSLKAIYDEIGKMEKTRFEGQNSQKKTELFAPYAIIALVILMLEFLLRHTVFRSIP
ncbi:MAG: VWA domain-containing protein [Bacteroidota bacterium]